MTSKKDDKGEKAGGSKHALPLAVLDDVCCRFILNLPEEEQFDIIRVLFQVESAHWFYLDHLVKEALAQNLQTLKPCSLREFTQHVFRHVPFLNEYAERIDEVMLEWQSYKSRVPTFGAVLLDESLDNVLLVRGIRPGSSWSFPRGKINQGEDPTVCAAREVLEETGFDVSKMISADQFIESSSSDGTKSTSRLYVIRGVPMDFPFAPRTVGEIGKIQWFRLDQLPTSKKHRTAGNNANFFLLQPFIRNVRTFVRTLERGPSAVVSSGGEEEETMGPFHASLDYNYIFGNGWDPKPDVRAQRERAFMAEVGNAVHFKVLPILYGGSMPHVNNRKVRR